MRIITPSTPQASDAELNNLTGLQALQEVDECTYVAQLMAQTVKVVAPALYENLRSRKMSIIRSVIAHCYPEREFDLDNTPAGQRLPLVIYAFKGLIVEMAKEIAAEGVPHD